MSSEISQVAYRFRSTGDSLKIRGACHPAIRSLLRRRPHLEWIQLGEQLATPPKNANMRAKELVGGDHKVVTIKGTHIDRTVRRVVNGIHPELRADSVHPAQPLPSTKRSPLPESMPTAKSRGGVPIWMLA